jgi:hypothetical protein
MNSASIIHHNNLSSPQTMWQLVFVINTNMYSCETITKTRYDYFKCKICFFLCLVFEIETLLHINTSIFFLLFWVFFWKLSLLSCMSFWFVIMRIVGVWKGFDFFNVFLTNASDFFLHLKHTSQINNTEFWVVFLECILITKRILGKGVLSNRNLYIVALSSFIVQFKSLLLT